MKVDAAVPLSGHTHTPFAVDSAMYACAQVTYPMHIIVRYEIEVALMDGTLKVGVPASHPPPAAIRPIMRCPIR